MIYIILSLAILDTIIILLYVKPRSQSINTKETEIEDLFENDGKYFSQAIGAVHYCSN